MKELAQLREALDQVDQSIVRLFEQRMELSRQVAQAKIRQGLPVLDQAREAQVLDSRANMLFDPYWDQAVRELYQKIMELSRREQEAVGKGAKRHD